MALSEALKVTASLTSLNILSNKLDVESVGMLQGQGGEAYPPHTLRADARGDAARLEFRRPWCRNAMLLAPEISVIASLTRVR